MRKGLILLSLLMFFVMSGCTIRENTEEYRQLSNQFDRYQLGDINSDVRFENMLKDITYSAIVSAVRLEIRIYTSLGSLIETRFASGMLFGENQEFYYLLTELTVTQVTDPYELWIEVTDYKNESYRGYLVQRSEDLGLAAIRFMKNPLKTLKVAELATTLPYVGEPLMLIGFVNRTNNGTRMGLLSALDLQDNGHFILSTTIPSDLYAKGALILNIHAEVIGLQFAVENGYAKAYDMSQIRHMMDQIII